MTVEDVVLEYIKLHGFDGLSGDGCGCELLEDFMPCGKCIQECNLGYRCPCEECDDETKDNCEYYSSDFDFMILPEKCGKRIELEKSAWEARND